MDRTLFIADTHFFHENVIGFDGRPWRSLQEMHDGMLQAWNDNVDSSDDVHILGDYTWKLHDEAIEFLNKLKGRKHLILGNHDSDNASSKFKKMFLSIKNYNIIKVKLEDGTTKKCVLSHFYMPFYEGHFRGDILLHGHSHMTREHYLELNITDQLLKLGSPMQVYNVGATLPYINYIPRTLDEIIRGGDAYLNEINERRNANEE